MGLGAHQRSRLVFLLLSMVLIGLLSRTGLAFQVIHVMQDCLTEEHGSSTTRELRRRCRRDGLYSRIQKSPTYYIVPSNFDPIIVRTSSALISTICSLVHLHFPLTFRIGLNRIEICLSLAFNPQYVSAENFGLFAVVICLTCWAKRSH